MHSPAPFACVLQVRAEKQITIEEAPNVLTIHLKRFQFGGMGSKITKPVDYDKEMNLQPFMSRPECGPQVRACCGRCIARKRSDMHRDDCLPMSRLCDQHNPRPSKLCRVWLAACMHTPGLEPAGGVSQHCLVILA